jgi:hypothetical protein
VLDLGSHAVGVAGCRGEAASGSSGVPVRDTHGRLRDFSAFLCEEPEPNHSKLAAWSQCGPSVPAAEIAKVTGMGSTEGFHPDEGLPLRG